MFRKDCPSGQLDRDKFGKIYKRFFPHGEPSEFADHVFNLLDENKNGIVDLEEFVRVMSIIDHGQSDKCTLDQPHRTRPFDPILLPVAFQLYDIDGDGIITYQEMLSIVRSIDRMTGWVDKLPSDIDSPENVRLSSNHLYTMLHTNYL